jgi:hypothetical protein
MIKLNKTTLIKKNKTKKKQSKALFQLTVLREKEYNTTLSFF